MYSSVFKKRSCVQRGTACLLDTFSSQFDDEERYPDFTKLKYTFLLWISDFTPRMEPGNYITDSIDKNQLRENPFDVCFGLTIVELSNFTLLIDQVKTPTEKWCYFLRHGSTRNFEKMIDDDANVFGNDAIFRRAYEELHQEFWSEEEIHMYKQEMQKSGQQDAEESLDEEESSDEEKRAKWKKAVEVNKETKLKRELEKKKDKERELVIREELKKMILEQQKVEYQKAQSRKAELRLKKAGSELKKAESELKEAELEFKKVELKKAELKKELELKNQNRN